MRGCLFLLSEERNFEEFGSVSVAEVADTFRQTLFDFNQGDCVLVPIGACMDFAGDVIPDGWLDTNQGAVSRTTYAALFAVIGTQFGSGDGTTTFDLPHKDGRVTVGLKPGDSDFNILGENGGAKTHTLTVGEMPSHNHTQNSHNHVQDAHNHTQNAHAHTVFGAMNADTGTTRRQVSLTTGGSDAQTQATTPTNQATTPTNQVATATNQVAGGGGSHPNMPPYLTLNFIIRAL